LDFVGNGGESNAAVFERWLKALFWQHLKRIVKVLGGLLPFFGQVLALANNLPQ
jgi:hypothetical protein